MFLIPYDTWISLKSSFQHENVNILPYIHDAVMASLHNFTNTETTSGLSI